MRVLLLIILILNFFAATSQPKSYTFVFLHKKATMDTVPQGQVEKIMQGHLANIERLAKEDKLAAAGPFEGGGGIFILNTTSREQAEEWLSTDPGIRANRWNVEMLPYSPRIGSVCQAKEPYEMVAYAFIRFTETGTNDGATATVIKEHDRFIEEHVNKGNVITRGAFEPTGEILILKNDVNNNNNFIESDPAVKRGMLKAESKKLWIAKGSFCEK